MNRIDILISYELSAIMAGVGGDILDEEYYEDTSDVLEVRSEVGSTEPEETDDQGDGDSSDTLQGSRLSSRPSQYGTPPNLEKVSEEGRQRRRVSPDPIPRAFRLRRRNSTDRDQRRCRQGPSKPFPGHNGKGGPHKVGKREEDRSCIKPPKFEGKDACIESHLAQFEIIARRNGWNSLEKANYLKCTLVGEANHILRDLSDQASYKEVVSRLRQRYGSIDRMEACRVALKTRTRRPGESMSQLMKDICSLFLQAYPGPSNSLSEVMARDAFVNALQDRDLMIKVLKREPATLEQAYKIAERLELYRSLPVGSEEDGNMKLTVKVRHTKTLPDDKLLQSLAESQKALQKQIVALTKAFQNSRTTEQASDPVQATPNGSRVICHYCQKPGHYKSDCGARTGKTEI